MSDKTRHCVNCGEQFIAFPKNRKYCTACQCLRDLDYRRGTPKQCDECSRNFWPIRSSYTTCYTCADWRGGVRDSYPECAVCGKKHRTAPGVEKTCVDCVQSSKEMQHRYYLTLRKIVHDRIALKEAAL